MAKIQAGQPIDLIVLSKAEAKVADYKWSELSLADFSNEHLGTWAAVDGSSVTGTLYQTLTGKASVPDATIDGLFIRVAKPGRSVCSIQSDAFQGHFHNGRNATSSSGNGSIAGGGASAVTNATCIKDPISDGTNGTPRVADETRPKNIALNLYVKVAY